MPQAGRLKALGVSSTSRSAAAGAALAGPGTRLTEARDDPRDDLLLHKPVHLSSQTEIGTKGLRLPPFGGPALLRTPHTAYKVLAVSGIRNLCKDQSETKKFFRTPSNSF